MIFINRFVHTGLNKYMHKYALISGWCILKFVLLPLEHTIVIVHLCTWRIKLDTHVEYMRNIVYVCAHNRRRINFLKIIFVVLFGAILVFNLNATVIS